MTNAPSACECDWYYRSAEMREGTHWRFYCRRCDWQGEWQQIEMLYLPNRTAKLPGQR